MTGCGDTFRSSWLIAGVVLHIGAGAQRLQAQVVVRGSRYVEHKPSDFRGYPLAYEFSAEVRSPNAEQGRTIFLSALTGVLQDYGLSIKSHSESPSLTSAEFREQIRYITTTSGGIRKLAQMIDFVNDRQLGQVEFEVLKIPVELLISSHWASGATYFTGTMRIRVLGNSLVGKRIMNPVEDGELHPSTYITASCAEGLLRQLQGVLSGNGSNLITPSELATSKAAIEAKRQAEISNARADALNAENLARVARERETQKRILEREDAARRAVQELAELKARVGVKEIKAFALNEKGLDPDLYSLKFGFDPGGSLTMADSTGTTRRWGIVSITNETTKEAVDDKSFLFIVGDTWHAHHWKGHKLVSTSQGAVRVLRIQEVMKAGVFSDTTRELQVTFLTGLPIGWVEPVYPWGKSFVIEIKDLGTNQIVDQAQLELPSGKQQSVPSKYIRNGRFYIKLD